MREHFRLLARYNQWANAGVFGAARALGEADYRRDTGIFFKSLHGTLNHLLVIDRNWLSRITGQDNPQIALDTTLYEDREDLLRARIREDQRLIETIDRFAPDEFAENISYRNSTGAVFQQPLQDILAHLFNHQTHHRGHAHACLSILGAAPPVLDLVAFQRGLPAPAFPNL